MSASSPIGSWHFRLDGSEDLGFSYDDEADVLYLWRGDAPREAIGIQTAEGHLVRVDEDTGEVVGFTIFNWATEWKPLGSVQIEVPDLEAADGTHRHDSHELELVPA